MSASTVDKNLLLVTTIKNYPCLYNQNSPEYLKKDAAERAWSEIASQVQLSVNEMKEKWRNLRYSLLRSLKPNYDGSAKKKYYLHDEMEFLIPFMKLKGQGNLAPFEEDTDEETLVFTDENGEVLSQQPLCEYEFYTEPSAPKKRKIENQVNLRTSTNEHSRKFFLISLLPEINILTEYQMKMFRRKVFVLLDDLTESTNNYDGQSRQNNDDAVISDIIKTEPL